MQTAFLLRSHGDVHSGVARYKPNSLDGGCPSFAGEHAYIERPVPIAATATVREAPASFADHFSRPRQFWLNLSPSSAST
ncbi:hypothetical protein [Kitasatospora sp. NPDC091207]|uniref:hypothetical protein n=1 Tax=Kitasatospora sp. NPDC091207 TaxID=3364083 RepID=UPI0037F17DA9